MSYTVEGSVPEGNNPLYDDFDYNASTDFKDDWTRGGNLSDPWGGWGGGNNSSNQDGDEEGDEEQNPDGGGANAYSIYGDDSGGGDEAVESNDPQQAEYRDQIVRDMAQLHSQLERSEVNDNAPKRRMSFVIAQKRAEAAEREKRAFTAWANTWLSKRDMLAQDLGSDFADGVLMINLLEIALETEIGRYNMRPKSPMQKLDNVSLAFSYLSNVGIRLVSTDIHDIVAKKEKQIINVLSAVLRHLVTKGIQSEMGGTSTNVRQNLLAWVTKYFPHLKILDFWASWKDGIGFCSIVDKLSPGKIDVPSLNSLYGQDNIKLAFDTAEKHLGIPPLLQPEDFLAEKGDDQLVMNYIAMLLSASAATRDDKAREEEMERLKNEMAQREKLIEAEIITKQKQLDEISAKLTAALEDANSSSNALSKASENERKWRDATEKWRDSSRKWRESAEKWRSSDEKKTNQIKQMQSVHAEEVKKLNAEMYRMHREHEELLERLREKAAAEVKSNRLDNPHANAQPVHGQSRSQRSKTRAVTSAITAASRTDEEFLSLIPVKSGWLMRRRPNATFNKTRFKRVYFVVNGSNLDYLKEEGGKVKGSFPLTDYHIVTQIPPEKRIKEDGSDLIMRMNSNKSESANLTIEFKAPAEEGSKHPSGVDGLTYEWVDAINTRISLLHYMKRKETKRGTAWGCSELVQFICDSKSNELLITNHPLGIREPLLALKPALLAQRHRLTSIVINNCELDDVCAEVLADLLKCSKAITHMDLSHNKITAVGAGHLCDGLVKNQSLTSLILDNNHLQDDGLVRLSPALATHHNLDQLSLVGNAIGDNGIVALCHALELSGQKRGSPHIFPEFNLSFNLVGDAGLIAIATLIPSNPSIRTVILDNNLVGDAGVVALATSIEQTDGQIKDIHLAFNQISSKGLAALSHTFKVLKSDLIVDISENKLVSRAGLAALVDAKVKIDYILLKLYKLPGSVEDNKDQKEMGDIRVSAKSMEQDAEQVAKIISTAKTQMHSRRTSLITGKGQTSMLSANPNFMNALSKLSEDQDEASKHDKKAEQAEWEAEVRAAHTRPRTSTTVPTVRTTRGVSAAPLPLPPTPGQQGVDDSDFDDDGGNSSDDELFPGFATGKSPKGPPPPLPARPSRAGQ